MFSVAYKVRVGDIFDLGEGMPFTPADYGEDGDIIRQCEHCERSHPQKELKELSQGSLFGSGLSENKLYADGIFVCEECWQERYADLSNWAG